jgi:hypothetical protein
MEKATKSSEWWEIACDGEKLKKCRQDPRFPYLVTLARATNALNLATAILPHIENISSPVGARDLWNSFFFTCGILYEALQLTKKMNQAFANDDRFQKGLKMLLKDPRAKRVEDRHWAPVRNKAVFHFDPSWFAERLKQSDFDNCILVRAEGKAKKGVYYSFADEVAFELMIDLPIEAEEFRTRLSAMAKDTTVLAIEFANQAEILISHTLHDWGFTYAQIPASITSSRQ